MRDTDYLIVGAGAVGLAFADSLISHSDAKVVIVDKNQHPGGHWNFAYDFVRLHQPSEFYGVESVPLGSGVKDIDGWNAGFYQLASGAEVLDYFNVVMADHLLPSGRVSYHPKSTYLGDGRIAAIETGEEIQFKVRKKTVDATYFGTTIPSRHTPSFSWDDDVRIISPNALSGICAGHEDTDAHYCILGAGKTAMDVGVWLRAQGIGGDQVTWVKPRDSWLMNRKTLQPGPEFFQNTVGTQAKQMSALAETDSARDLFHRLESIGMMARIFPDVEPAMFHCAIISDGEIALLRQIQNIVRQGHVQNLTRSAMILDGGSVPMPAHTLYIDCTASAVARQPQVPVFGEATITPQIVRTCQPAFSAAMLGFIETLDLSVAEKNALSQPLGLPDRAEDYFSIVLTNMMNQYVWSRHPQIRAWLMKSRLDGFTRMIADLSQTDPSAADIVGAFRANAPSAISNIQLLMQRDA